MRRTPFGMVLYFGILHSPIRQYQPRPLNQFQDQFTGHT